MMRYLLIVLFLFSLHPVSALGQQNQPASPTSLRLLDYVRSEFEVARTSKAIVTKLIYFVDSNVQGNWENHPNSLFAYYAALKGLQAKFAINPFKKLHNLKTSLRLFDQAVDKTPNDLEVRFLRYAAYSQYPKIDHISEKKSEDLEVIMQLLNQRQFAGCEAARVLQILDYLHEHGELGNNERQILAEIKTELANP